MAKAEYKIEEIAEGRFKVTMKGHKIYRDQSWISGRDYKDTIDRIERGEHMLLKKR